MGWKDRPYYNDREGGVPPMVFSFPPLTPLTGGVILTCLVVLLVQSFGSGAVTRMGGLTFQDGLAYKEPWRWITYQYLHGSALHFFFNMLGVYFFLPTLEMLWGWKRAFAFYTMGGIVAGVIFGILCAAFYGDRPLPIIGASGSVLAALGAVALLSPGRQIIVLFFPLPIRVAAGLFGAFFLLSAIADRDLSNAAHLGGLAFGFFAPYVGGPVVRKLSRKYERRRRLRELEYEREEQERVDAILAKVSQHGMHSLTWLEKRTLRKATEHQREREMARPKW
jgi:membrane associated rhomboid family serine protease